MKSRAILRAPSGTGRGWRRGRGPGAGRWRRRRRRTEPAAPWWRPGEAAPVRYGGREGPEGALPQPGGPLPGRVLSPGPRMRCTGGSVPRGTLNTGAQAGLGLLPPPTPPREAGQCWGRGAGRSGLPLGFPCTLAPGWLPRLLARARGAETRQRRDPKLPGCSLLPFQAPGRSWGAGGRSDVQGLPRRWRRGRMGPEDPFYRRQSEEGQGDKGAWREGHPG